MNKGSIIKGIIGLFVVVMLCGGLPVTAASAKRLAVQAAIGNVRSGPGTEHYILWQVERYYPVKIIESAGQWYRFTDFEGDQGWIHKSLLASIQTVITAKEKCNIRMGPGTRFDVVMTVEKGIPFKVVTQKGDWLNIRHADGDSGWIHKSLIW